MPRYARACSPHRRARAQALGGEGLGGLERRDAGGLRLVEDAANGVADRGDAAHDLVAAAELLRLEVEVDDAAGVHHEVGGVQDAAAARRSAPE